MKYRSSGGVNTATLATPIAGGGSQSRDSSDSENEDEDELSGGPKSPTLDSLTDRLKAVESECGDKTVAEVKVKIPLMDYVLNVVIHLVHMAKDFRRSLTSYSIVEFIR